MIRLKDSDTNLKRKTAFADMVVSLLFEAQCVLRRVE